MPHGALSLTIKALDCFVHFCIDNGDQRVFQFEIIRHVMGKLFVLHLNTYVVGLRPL